MSDQQVFQLTICIPGYYRGTAHEHTILFSSCPTLEQAINLLEDLHVNHSSEEGYLGDYLECIKTLNYLNAWPTLTPFLVHRTEQITNRENWPTGKPCYVSLEKREIHQL